MPIIEELTSPRYGELAYLRYGALFGSWLTFWRLFRCTPWGGHGYDPVPERRDGRPDPVDAPTQLPPAPGDCPVCAAHGHAHPVAASPRPGRARRAARRQHRTRRPAR